MQIDDIDFTRGVIKVMGKGAKERVVPIQQRHRKPYYAIFFHGVIATAVCGYLKNAVPSLCTASNL